jgi:hypothetical protein
MNGPKYAFSSPSPWKFLRKEFQDMQGSLPPSVLLWDAEKYIKTKTT